MSCRPFLRTLRRTGLSILLLASLTLLAAPWAVADEAELVRDIEPSAEGWQQEEFCDFLCIPPSIRFGSHPRQITPVGDLIFFRAFDISAGEELWVSDGTAEGTRRVADHCPGPCDGNPLLIAPYQGELYYWAADREREDGPNIVGSLWRTDGTEAGTRRVEGTCQDCFYYGFPDAVPGHGGVVLGDVLYFLAPIEGRASFPVLWRTDGTAEGTRPFYFQPQPGAELLPVTMVDSGPDYLAVAQEPGGEALYMVRYAENFDEVDTLLRLGVGDAMPQPVVPSCERFDRGPFRLLPSSSGVAFLAECLDAPGLDSADRPLSLYISDGSKAGTRLLAESFMPLDWLGKHLYYVLEGETGNELWRVDPGTGSRERLFAGLPGGRPFDGISSVVVGFAHEGRLYLRTVSEQGRWDLWSYRPGWPSPPRELVRDVTSSHQGRRSDWRIAPGPGFLLLSVNGEGGSEPWASDGTPEGTRRLLDIRPGPEGSNPRWFTLVGDQVYLSADDGVHDQELMRFPLELADPGACITGGGTLCLGDGRFAVRVRFRNQHAGGAEGVGTALAGTADAGFFWFFRESNLELTVKVLDGTGINGHHWVFYGGITDLEYDIEVTDLERDLTRTYHHVPGDLCGGADTLAFPATEGAAAAVDGLSSTGMQGFLVPMEAEEDLAPTSRAAAPLTPPPCHATDTQLCIGGVFQTYAVEVTYRNQYAGGVTGQGHGIQMSDDSGWFWFFNPDNPEVMVKVLNGYGVNGHAWVFVGGLSTVEYEVTVTDTSSGGHPTRIFRKPPESTCGFADVTAFPIP